MCPLTRLVFAMQDLIVHDYVFVFGLIEDYFGGKLTLELHVAMTLNGARLPVPLCSYDNIINDT